jgi:hypothetical protein
MRLQQQQKSKDGGPEDCEKEKKECELEQVKIALQEKKEREDEK